MTRVPTRPVLLIAALLALAGPARAQMESREGIALQNQILELRRDLDAQRATGGGVQPSYQPQPSGPIGVPGGGDISVTLLDRVTRLEDQVRELRGQLEQEQNARQRQGEELNKQVGDLNFKLGNGALAPAVSPPSRPVTGQLVQPATPGLPPPPAAQARRTPEIALAEGNAAYARRDYAGAQTAARQVLAAGKGPRVTDAQFLLAQSLAATRDYQGAAVAYDDSYRRSPRGSRAADSLLGLANSLLALNERKAACETLDRARVEFPQARPDLRPSLAAARVRAGCPA